MAREKRLKIAKETMVYANTHTGTDYPVGIYYVELSKMFLERAYWHWHEELEIALVRKGTAVFCMGEKTYRVSSGSAVLLNGNHLHSIYAEEPCEIISTMFNADYLFGGKETFLFSKYAAAALGNGGLTIEVFSGQDLYGRTALEYIRNIVNTNLEQPFGYELITKSELSKLWMHYLNRTLKLCPALKKGPSENLSSAEVDEERTKKAILFIQNHYEKKITLDDIAEYVHVSKSECCRFFKRSMDVSPFDYLNTWRVYMSAVKMQQNAQEKYQIANLAEEVGFQNASYFNKIFKRTMNTTPLEYREEIKRSHRDALSPYGIPLARM
ncbi:MAG: AraC family transcriptional regulator [Lachnospiraceae bacterium]|nr:AraC family transcriptional regulator [Lachnospiraceae bacterium]